MGLRIGKFIVFEGPDAVGKSTLIESLKDSDFGSKNPLFVRDPGGTNIGQGIRKILLDPENTEMSQETEIMLYLSSRAQLVKEVIEPALFEGRDVISDRYTLSTMIYQRIGDGVDIDDLKFLCHYAECGVRPDHTFILKAPFEKLQERLNKNGKDRMEGKGKEYLKKVYLHYSIEYGKANGDKIISMDADRESKDVLRETIRLLRKLL